MIREHLLELRRWGRLRSACALLAILWLMFFYDIGMRVFVPRDATLRKFDAPMVPQLPVPTASAAIEAALKGWFPPPEVPKEALRKLLALQGVLANQAVSKAVLTVSSPEGVFESRRVVMVGDEIDGWRVTRIERAGVTLVRSDNEQQETKMLKMFASRPGGSP